MADVSGAKTRSLAAIIGQQGAAPKTILVVGCGSGVEAMVLADYFDAETTGIDLGDQFTFDPQAQIKVRLLKMDAHKLEFPDETFDLVFSFHAVEHVANPEKVLSEMRRVVKRDGIYCVGTPNKARLVGYLGAAASLKNKILWNLADLKARATGRWENHLGAHAGFHARDLIEMCRSAFGEGTDVSLDYYGNIYSSPAISTIFKSKAGKFLRPCCYVVGRRIN